MDTKLDVETRVLHLRWQLFDLGVWIKSRIWNRGILLAWNRLWIRKDEFHNSLSLDPFAMRGMNKKQKSKYLNDLARRRNIAHQRDLRAERVGAI